MKTIVLACRETVKRSAGEPVAIELESDQRFAPAAVVPTFLSAGANLTSESRGFDP